MYEIEKPFVVQTVTAFYKGILEEVTEQEFVLTKCSWVADTGRFHKFVESDENVNEEEPFPIDKKVMVGRGAMVCAYHIDNLTHKVR